MHNKECDLSKNLFIVVFTYVSAEAHELQQSYQIFKDFKKFGEILYRFRVF